MKYFAKKIKNSRGYFWLLSEVQDHTHTDEIEGNIVPVDRKMECPHENIYPSGDKLGKCYSCEALFEHKWELKK